MSWIDNLSKNLIKNVEVTIGDNKTIAEMVDGNLKVEHYYKNEIIIEKPIRIGVNTISRTTNSNANRNLRTHHQYLKILYHLGQINRCFTPLKI